MAGSIWLVSVSVRGAAAAAALLLVGLVLACGDAEEEVAPQTTASSTPAAASVTPSPTAQPPTPSPTPEASPQGIPADWESYTDSIVGFSLRYPPDLALKDLSGDAGRVLDFRATKDAARGFSVEVYANAKGVTPREWAVSETSCLRESIEDTTIAGQPAVSCTEQATEIPHPTVVFGHMGMIYEIGGLLSQAEFDSLLASLRL